MTLQASRPMTLPDDVHAEMYSSGALDLNGSAVRWLAERPAGQSLTLPDHLLGKRSIKHEDTAFSSTTSTHTINGVNFGQAFSGRRIALIFMCAGKPGGTVPSGTQSITNINIGGTAASDVGMAYYQGGSGSGIFVGIAIRSVSKPTGTSGTVSFNTPFNTTPQIVVLSFPDYTSVRDQTSTFSSSSDTLSDTIDVPGNGTLIAFALKNDDNQMNFSGVTERGRVNFGGYEGGFAFDNRMSAQTGRSFNFSDPAGNNAACVLGGITLDYPD